ncbi:MAG: DM13 domain-containing protein [Pseudomonadota bacterium]
MRWIVRFFSHGVALAIGFGFGVYLLPILTAPESPDEATLMAASENATFRADLTRDLRGSDFAHWGEGTISLSGEEIAHMGRLSPGPDYQLYLTKTFVEHEDEFLPIKDQAVRIESVKSFGGFVLPVPEDVDVSEYTTVLIWCEAFAEFITAAQYQ